MSKILKQNLENKLEFLFHRGILLVQSQLLQAQFILLIIYFFLIATSGKLLVKTAFHVVLVFFSRI